MRIDDARVRRCGARDTAEQKNLFIKLILRKSDYIERQGGTNFMQIPKIRLLSKEGKESQEKVN